MKRIALLGSTGSIGENALNIARHLKGEIEVKALAARSNIELLEMQAREFLPEVIGVYDPFKAAELQKKLPHCQVIPGMEGLKTVAALSDVDLVISAISGTIGLEPTVAAIESGKNVGLANKEALVSGGEFVMSLAKKKNVQIIPIDSEHSAIFQCLQGQKREAISRIILTSSGGPFRLWTDEQLASATVDDALRHPTWKMGPKVTIDSSTLMNKGLEVIEAHWLFSLPVSQIDVIVHPQSIIHSMVEFIDQSMLAQMSEPTMKVPIQYAMTYPERSPGMLKPFDFFKNGLLQFFLPDKKKFKCLSLAYEAVQKGGSLPCYMNAANEVLVHRFLAREINWGQIGNYLENLMARHEVRPVDTIESILAIDEQARRDARSCNYEDALTNFI